jgi:hypothetical protein
MSSEFEMKTLKTRVDILSNIRRHQRSIVFSSQQFKRFIIIEMLDLRVIMILLKQLAPKTFRENIIFFLIISVAVGLGFVRVGLLVRSNRTGWTLNVVRRLGLGLSLCSTLEPNPKPRCPKP